MDFGLESDWEMVSFLCDDIVLDNGFLLSEYWEEYLEKEEYEEIIMHGGTLR